MDVDNLLKALDNEKNETIMNLTTKKIKEMNLKILKELDLPKQDILVYLKKLSGYVYIDELKDVKCGAFIKWIPITNPDNLPLHSGGIICDIKIQDTGIFIICKNFMHKHYQVKMDESLIFQKLTNQEQILLSALDYLAK